MYLKDLKQVNINSKPADSEIGIPKFSADLPTLINGSLEFMLSTKIWIMDAINFTFSYTNESGIPLTGLSNKSYSWIQYNDLNETIDSGSGFLIENVNHHYVLDFDTETRDVGTYEINATFDKDNYDSKNATIILTISLRVFEYQLSPNFQNNQITVSKDETVPIEIILTDPAKENVPVVNASITLTTSGIIYSFINLFDGTYLLVFPTINTAFPITGNINISKENYTSVEFTIRFLLKGVGRIPGYSLFSLLGISAIVVMILGKKLKKS
jgi:hypothetical protein